MLEATATMPGTPMLIMAGVSTKARRAYEPEPSADKADEEQEGDIVRVRSMKFRSGRSMGSP